MSNPILILLGLMQQKMVDQYHEHEGDFEKSQATAPKDSNTNLLQIPKIVFLGGGLSALPQTRQKHDEIHIPCNHTHCLGV